MNNGVNITGRIRGLDSRVLGKVWRNDPRVIVRALAVCMAGDTEDCVVPYTRMMNAINDEYALHGISYELPTKYSGYAITMNAPPPRDPAELFATITSPSIVMFESHAQKDPVRFHGTSVRVRWRASDGGVSHDAVDMEHKAHVIHERLTDKDEKRCRFPQPMNLAWTTINDVPTWSRR